MLIDNVPISGICPNYIPKSSSYTVEVLNFEVDVDNSIDYITKVSCFCDGTFKGSFEAVGANYTSINVSFDLRVDYIHNDKDISFHLFDFDKFMYVNTLSPFNRNFSSIDCELLDLDIVSIDNNKIIFYALVIACIY